MKKDTPLAAWQNGVPLRDALWTFADAQKKEFIYQLGKRKFASSDVLQRLKDELIDRFYAGHLYAFGFGNDRNSGSTCIPEYYL
jgi:hypothetical protein